MFLYFFVFTAFAENLKKLPLPDDFDELTVKKTVEKEKPISDENVIKSTQEIQVKAKEETPEVIVQPSEKIENQTIKSTDINGTKILPASKIDENYQILNKVSDAVFTSLRAQYSYIIKLENEINRLRAILEEEQKKMNVERKNFENNINKLKEQNESYLRIFDKLRNDNQKLMNNITALQEAMKSRDFQLNKLNASIKALYDRLLQIKNLSTVNPE